MAEVIYRYETITYRRLLKYQLTDCGILHQLYWQLGINS
jgi:hypothetical protein